MKIHWSDGAKSDLGNIVAYIELDSIRSARRVAQMLISGVEAAVRFPQRGRVSELTGCRELVFPSLPYIVVYRVSDEQIEILRVLHGAQRWPGA